MSNDRAKTPSSHRVFIVDDHPLVRRGLQALIALQPDLEVCGEAEDEAEAMERIRQAQPDVVVVDLMLRRGSGLSLLKRLDREFPKLKMLVLSMHCEATYVQRAVRLGARGYVLKEEGTERIIQAVRTVLQGDFFLSRAVAARWTPGKIGEHHATSAEDSLTHREIQVLEMIGYGMRSDEIATCFGVSVATVESHRERIKTKLGLRHGSALNHYAYNWVFPPPKRQCSLHPGRQ